MIVLVSLIVLLRGFPCVHDFPIVHPIPTSATRMGIYIRRSARAAP